MWAVTVLWYMTNADEASQVNRATRQLCELSRTVWNFSRPVGSNCTVDYGLVR